MRILLLNLLRPGDIFMQAPLFEPLASEGHEVHLMINRECSSVLPLLKGISAVHFFERSDLQSDLGAGQGGWIQALVELNGWVARINETHFHKVINLTQNRLSARVMDLVCADEKVGLQYVEKKLGTFGSPWLQYLNYDEEAIGASAFHFNDIFFHALGLRGLLRKFEFQETGRGREEAKPYQNLTSVVAIQALTSDEKKNWGLSQYFVLANELLSSDESINVVFLGAPGEKALLSEFVQSFTENKNRIHLAIVSFEGAYSLLKKAEVLITGDTSIKHLAVGAECGIFEISVGSSRPHQTGAYKESAFVIRAGELCYPCPHRNPCLREKRFCASQIEPLDVADILVQYLAGSKQIPSGVNPSFSISRVVKDPFGDFSLAAPAKAKSNLAKFAGWIWKVTLDRRLLEDFDCRNAHVRSLTKSVDLSLVLDEWDTVEGALRKTSEWTLAWNFELAVEFLKAFDQLEDSVNILQPLRRVLRDLLDGKEGSAADVRAHCDLALGRLQIARVLCNLILEGDIENGYRPSGKATLHHLRFL